MGDIAMQSDILESEDFSKIKPIMKSWYASELKNGNINNGKNCLTNEQIYKYTEHTLDESEREAVYEHISTCMPCYIKVEHYYEKRQFQPEPELMLKILEEKTKEYIEDDKGIKALIKIFFAQFITLMLAIQFIQKRYVIGATALFVAGIVLLLNLNTQAPYITLIEQSFEIAKNQKLFFISDYGNFPGQKEAFSEHIEKKAFEDGIAFAKQNIFQEIGKPLGSDETIIQKDTWSKTPQVIYFWLGNWFTVLKNVCHSGEEINAEYWNVQLKTLKEFQTSFAKAPPYDEKLNTDLEQLDQFIRETLETPLQKRDLKLITEFLDKLIKRLQL